MIAGTSSSPVAGRVRARQVLAHAYENHAVRSAGESIGGPYCYPLSRACVRFWSRVASDSQIESAPAATEQKQHRDGSLSLILSLALRGRWLGYHRGFVL
jgi:hypothetical protein